jgi:hypothetical protein
LLIKKAIEINGKYNNDTSKIKEVLIDQFQHYFSRILYISLPLFALFLWVLYRRNKNHFFADHIIFSIHLYCAFFILLFALRVFNIITEWIFQKSFGLANVATIGLLFFYLYKALKNHFNQSRSKTILKFLILNVLTFILMIFLMILFILLSIFNL